MSDKTDREAFEKACIEAGMDTKWLERLPNGFYADMELNPNFRYFQAGIASQQERIDELEAHVARLREAIRLTQEYCTDDILPPIKGWEWFDALNETKELNDE